MKYQCLALFLLTGLLTGCSSTQSTQATDNDDNQALSELVADKGCDASFQCKVIGVGERQTCGGPSQYVVYSVRNVDESQVERMALAITRQEHALNQQTPPSDVCKQVLPIQALCINSQCQAITLK
ncbi:hypothetical protein CWB99_23530 [Pseudoalteromonas rubra]|uniref:Lipoprotein n=1 Tax=Pseudoalteromonas rubra TaxID=43658 RepID=A0A5S3WEX0_9GAMM|nr:hypothetical protein [Pseudoalteromonas rubra]TMP23113.1 hypothetical protein CWB99_23530 [Pseudoalteromonas rubra]TMP33696.1 hypothetical protein CWC00_09920 [Pseudoalteromonas rubra]